MGLSETEIQRYARHIILAEVGGRGQLKLRAAGVLIVGLGGIGCTAAAYLAAAGVGRLGLADPRPVGAAPLSGGVLFTAADPAARRAAAAAAAVAALNPHVQAEALADWPAPRAGGWDAAIVTAGDWAAWTAADGAFLLLAGAAGDRGALAWLTPGPDGPARLAQLQAVAPALVPEAEPVFAPVAGAVGSAAATEAIKRILGRGRTLAGTLAYDGAAGRFQASGPV